jgi:DNA helicase-2/ATP-dependent DNA helicase PcrA
MVENGLQALDPSSDDNVYDDLQALLTIAADHKEPKAFLEFVDKMLEYSKSNENKKKVVELATYHALKGQERPNVFAAGWVEGVLPHVRSLNGENKIQTPLPVINDSDVSDERCIAFVAASRAMDCLYVSAYSQWKGGQEAQHSRFLDEMLGENIEWDAVSLA